MSGMPIFMTEAPGPGRIAFSRNRRGARPRAAPRAGGWMYKDRSVRMDSTVQRLATGLFGSAGQLVGNRFTGPGRVGLQSMYLHLPTEN